MAPEARARVAPVVKNGEERIFKTGESVKFGVKEAFRRSLLYGLRRRAGEATQLRNFVRLLNRLGSFHAETGASVELPERIKVPKHEIGLVGFGANDWEQRGLWPALARRGPFDLFEYRNACHRKSGSTRRRAEDLAVGFVEFVDHILKRRGVHAAFIYAAGYFLHPSLFGELRRRGIRTVLMGLDDKHQLSCGQGNIGNWQLEAARAADLYWTSWKLGEILLRREGVRAWYAPEAADSDQFSPRPRTRDLDVLWIGRA
jgi:hypothetical protein